MGTGINPALASDSLAGTWHGSLPLPGGMTLPLVFHFQETDAGYEGTMDSPAQNVSGIKLETVKIDADGTVHAGVGKANFTGKFDDKETLKGTWTESEVPIDLTLKAGVPEHPKRPQEPVPPFPYKSEDVSFKNGDVTLSGTLTHPEGIKVCPAVILLHGSGSHDRDETIFFHKPFLLLSDYLTRRGIAVLRYDKRGAGKSTGNKEQATTEDFANDGLAAFEFLKTRPDIDKTKIGLLGHSEGGAGAAMVAAKDRDVRFIVSMAGMGLPGEEILHGQRRILEKSQGMTPEAIEETEKHFSDILAIIRSEKDNDLVMEKLKNKNLKMLTVPYFRHFISFDPAPIWAKVGCPVLALDGDRDMEVIADENLEAITKALQSGGNNNVTATKLPGLNHLFQSCKTGLPNEYAVIEETIAPQVLEIISTWILQQTK